MDFEDNNPFSVGDGEPIAVPDDSATSRLAHRDSKLDETDLANAPVTIVDAGKSREGNKRGHITYTIKIGSKSVRRRYSEFESLRRTLRRLFPTLVVPPIPEKHSISAYAASPAHAQEDAKVIEHRRRMLTVFLNRCYASPEIRASALFERFLDPNSSWNEVLTSDIVASIPQSSLQAPPLDPAHPTPAHAHLPVPPSGAKLRQDPESEFVEAEATAKEYETLIGSRLDKTSRRIIKQYAALSADCADLGSQFNAFSLESASSVASAVEKVGQALDTGYLSTEALMETLGVEFSEPLGESVQLAATARQVLKYRRYRSLQVEMVSDQLASRREALSMLEKEENEAQRINSVLHADERINAALSGTLSGSVMGSSAGSGDAHTGTVDEDTSSKSMLSPVTSPSADSGSTPRPKRSGFRLPVLSSLNHAIHGMMDVDPETSRRNNISRIKEQISNLEAALEVARSDSAVATEAVREELARYKEAKEADLNRMTGVFLRTHIEWAEKNLQSWLEARQAISD